jgi:mono/diheme cytochrome c family protein
LILVPALTWAQNLQEVLKQGEDVFNKTCASGYCHGARGAGGGAPRLAARGFDQASIMKAVRNGIPGTAMQPFLGALPSADYVAVVEYVGSLNGIVIPLPEGSGQGGPPQPQLSPEATRGRELFSDAVRGFARCSTCHEINGIGISVAPPISQVPSGVQALRALTTPRVSTATASGESMPALMVSNTSRGVILYDLTSAPPVLRTLEPQSVTIADGSAWRHTSALGAYTDAEADVPAHRDQAVGPGMSLAPQTRSTLRHSGPRQHDLRVSWQGCRLSSRAGSSLLGARGKRRCIGST